MQNAMGRAAKARHLWRSEARGWRSTPGTTPATSYFAWLISITAMIVLSCSRAVRDLLASKACDMGRSIGLHLRRQKTRVPQHWFGTSLLVEPGARASHSRSGHRRQYCGTTPRSIPRVHDRARPPRPRRSSRLGQNTAPGYQALLRAEHYATVAAQHRATVTRARDQDRRAPARPRLCHNGVTSARSSRTIGCHRSSDRCALTPRLREGSRLTLRTSHTTINGGRVVRRSFPASSLRGRGPASSLPSSVQHF